MKKTTHMTIRSLKRQSEFLYQNTSQDNPEFTEILDKFIRDSVLQSTEGLQTCANSVEHDSPNKCGVSAPDTVIVGGPYSLGNSYGGGWTPYGLPYGSPNR
jgi:hypothetical protein